MKRLKKIGLTIIGFACVICLFAGYYKSKNWMYRYEAELDQFFGEGNWEYLSKETKKSTAFKEYYRGTRNTTSREYPGNYKNWYISFNNKYGEEEDWYISNHILKINNDRYDFFSSNRMSSREAFYLELMDIALYLASNEIFDEFIRSELTENEANSIDVSMYDRGKPKPKFYSSLSKEEWFTINNVTAEDFVFYDSQKFDIVIRARDYRLVKLTEQERQNVFDALGRVEKGLLEKYGERASFEIFFDGKLKVEYIDGKKQY